MENIWGKNCNFGHFEGPEYWFLRKIHILTKWRSVQCPTSSQSFLQELFFFLFEKIYCLTFFKGKWHSGWDDAINDYCSKEDLQELLWLEWSWWPPIGRWGKFEGSSTPHHYMIWNREKSIEHDTWKKKIFLKKCVIHHIWIKVCKCHRFSISQFLCEINFGDPGGAKSVILTHLKALNFDFYEI